MSDREHSGSVIDRVSGYEVIACEFCGFAHVQPMPDKEHFEKLYREEFYQELQASYIEEATEDRDWWSMSYDDRLAVLQEHLPASRRRILDIGSGPGDFLERALLQGWTPIGVEPSPVAATHSRARHLTIVNDFFDARLAKELTEFDAIHMGNMLEHVPDAPAMLDAAIQSLGKGGLIQICVPNDYSALQDTLRRVQDFRPWWVAPPQHLNYFTFDTLENLLRRHGLEPIDRFTTFPMELFLLLGFDYIKEPLLGRSCHHRRVGFEFILEKAGHAQLRRDLYRSLAKVGIGRDAIVTARKL
jgi:SAM-dependent methyltransferase